jgi:hypothetical protein
MHTPIMGDSLSGPNSGTEVYLNPSLLLLFPSTEVTDKNTLQMVDSYGGAFFTDLQPRTFWNKLGFSDGYIDSNIKFDQSVYEECER